MDTKIELNEEQEKIFDYYRKKPLYAYLYLLFYGSIGFHRFYLANPNSVGYGFFLMFMSIFSAYLEYHYDIIELRVVIGLLLILDYFLIAFNIRKQNYSLRKKILDGEITNYPSDKKFNKEKVIFYTLMTITIIGYYVYYILLN